MYHLNIWDTPIGTNHTMLEEGIIAVLVEALGIDPKQVKVMFPMDVTSEPETEAGYAIYVLLGNTPEDTDVQQLACKLGTFVWEFYSGKYKIKCFLGYPDVNWKYTLPAKPGS